MSAGFRGEQSRTNPAADRVAVVTGASRGIGAQLAGALSEDGFTVVLVGRHQRTLETAADWLSGPALPVCGDVTDPADVQRIVRTVRAELGRVDVLVNNAGARERDSTKPWEADADDWWHVVEVNLRGVMLMSSAVLPGMLDRRSGRIIDVSSGTGQRAEPRYSAYSVSKSAALRWTDNVVAGLGEDSPVRVVSASPGLVRTDMTETMWGPAGTVEFGSIDPMVGFVRRFAAGELDHLHGQFVHTVKDDY
ncbi:MAG: SDR family NAD(P)-dependent oxidoreductase [Nocardioidaceae bacterium]